MAADALSSWVKDMTAISSSLGELGPVVEVVEELESEKPRKCRPHDLSDFHRRLLSFRTHWWFNKPVGMSALAAARRGWINTG
eukprot:CAMPEP_0197672480 /NCGR_PEP_ID=MMETSP1338-20131121/79040_1 /TAXON_ID=43686 ORGANISM="Pelagodinium beii, Strain RCC1491" /NCGR_SAMPLE_ID=MMETSP1338 /ASSEMBLY_ACC=CAM_ASM_000754 /LENGTH=82 /DNA_ID=CAMNT_0043252591 /DNA_START=48 /DNA_END=292 /DNA_ORIENTATION=+